MPQLLELVAIVQQILATLTAVRDIVDQLHRAAGTTPAINGLTAPVWPGLAAVTLGTSVALTPLLTLTTPMDGVIVHVTSAPAGQSTYDYDGLTEYRYIGSLAFLNDDGEAEAYQQLGFADAIYSVRTFHRAAAVKLRTYDGIVGTVTPWTTK